MPRDPTVQMNRPSRRARCGEAIRDVRNFLRLHTDRLLALKKLKWSFRSALDKSAPERSMSIYFEDEATQSRVFRSSFVGGRMPRRSTGRERTTESESAALPSVQEETIPNDSRTERHKGETTLCVHGGSSQLWADAQEEFLTRIRSLHGGSILQENACDPLKWPEMIKLMQLGRGHFETLCAAIGKHMNGIRMAIEITSNVFRIVSLAVPVIAPANTITQAFALVLRTIVKSHVEIEQMARFFKEMEILFTDISIIGEQLRGDCRLGNLGERVAAVFSFSLKICTTALVNSNSKFTKWLLASLSGDDELDNLFLEMKSAKDTLIQCLNFSMYAEIRSTGHSIDVIESRLAQNERTEILSWLSPLNFDSFYEQLISQVQSRPNAGKWLLESQAFQNWKVTENSRLWYTGKPGAGKSVLSSIIIRHLTSTLKMTMIESAIVFLFMSHKNQPTVQELLGIIARQLAADMLYIDTSVEFEWRNTANRGKNADGYYTQPSVVVLERLITKMIGERPIFIILDAMDECNLNIRHEIITKLKNISRDVRLLVTSRLLEQRDELSVGFHMQTIQAQASDVGEYIDFMMDKDSKLQRGPRDDIKRIVTRKSGGMFLLVKLHMHALSNLDDDDDIDQILQTLPKDINESYANAILRVNNKDDARKKYARMILAWMAYVFRPLTFQELSHAIASQKSRAVVKLDKLLSKERIMSYCCGLVEIDIDDIVRFVHYSAQDFFRRKRDSEFYEFREQIPLACAKYLCMGGLVSPEELDHGSASSVDDLPRDEAPKQRDYSPVECATDNVHNHLQTSYQQEKPTIYSFMKYAAESLHKHFEIVREQEKSTDLFRYIRQLVEEKPKRRLYYSCVAPNGYYTPSSLLGESSRLGEPSRLYSSGNSAAKSLHLSVFLGCPLLVMNLIEKGADVNELDEFDQTPLAIAFKRNFSDIAALLLDHGATVDLTRKQGHTFLLYAAQRDFDAAVGKMLNKTRGSEFIWPPLQLDAPSVAPLPRRYTHTGILKDVHIKSRLISTFRSLRDRSEQDTAEPIDANEMLLRFGRILSLAYYGHTDELGRVADFPEFSDNRYDGPCICARDFLETACFLAVERGHAEIVEACLRGPHALDPNLKNFCGQPLLHRATFRNNITLVRLILDSGANANREDDNGRTAFTAHATMDREEVLSFLQTNGADIHHTGRHGVHELYRASAFGNIDMVRFFLDRGIDASITNIFSWKPLHEASANGHLECVKLLLEHGAHPSPISDVGKTPLDLMIEGDVHYDWPLLGDDSEHYLNGEPYKKKELGPEDIERRDEIVDLLKRHGAETADQLYAKDKSAFGHVAAGRYARGYESWETDWDE